MCSKPGSMGWIETNLGSIIELNYGKSLPAKTRDGGEFPVYGSNGIVGSHSKALVTEPGIIVGRKGSYGEVQFSDKPFYPIDTTYYVNLLYRQPLRYWFYQLVFLPLNQLNRSTAIPGLNRDDAYAQEIALPPLAEQQVIANKLDTLLAQVDNTKARLERIPEILKRFRQSVLAAAVSGRLTGGIDSSAVEDQTLKFEEILRDKKKLSYGVLKPGEFDEAGTSMIRVMDIGEWGKFNSTNMFKISNKLSYKFKKTIVEKGDIVLSVMATIGRPAIIPAHLAGANVNRALAVVKLKENMISEYVQLQLLSPYFQEAFVNKQIGSAQKRINLSDLRQFDIWVPDKRLQKEIVHRVDQLFAHADRIEQQVNQALTRVNNLTQSILAKAFRGELTEQWRKDNPELISGENSAEALLKRIKAERAAKAPAKRRKRSA